MARGTIQIAVIGGSSCTSEVRELARATGTEIARAGAILVCGGLGGVMEAAAAGAREAGGLTVGVLPSYDANSANSAIGVTIATGMAHARNVIVVASGDAVIALPGQHGTASEIALAQTLGRPVVALGAWSDCPGALIAETPVVAVRLAVSQVHGRQVPP
jgi:uncharacterized protein (TIGR00725 family)